MVTIKDVARRAGVSTATVSRVLNEHPSIAQEARQKVHDAIEELGYRPNAIARSLRMTTTSTIGLVVGSINNPYFAELARAVEDEARANGYAVITGNADERPEQQDHYVGTLLERRVDGLLIVPTADGSPLVRDAVRRGDHVVLVDRDIPDLDAPAVRVDGRRAVYDLVDHLVGLGHRRIGLIAGPQTTSTGRERLRTFVAALSGHGLPYLSERVQVRDFSHDSGVAAARDLLELRDPPTAVFATGNPLGVGALQEFRARDLRIPEDIGLAVFDDLPWFSLLDPPVTAIEQPTRLLGRAAVHALLARMRGEAFNPPALHARLLVRGSCGENAGRADTRLASNGTAGVGR